ncbi:hypothetical protein K9M48_01945 [Candidatus Gracilibacteria bacterium]|nr:hypothetical protein [Candidatus Gracilibacteria bacterium]
MKKSTKKLSIYKIIIPALLLVLVGIFLYIFSYNKTMPLEEIYIKSTFTVEEQDKFKQKLQESSGKKITSYTDAIDKARLYSYLGYPGKAIQVYKDFEKIRTGEYTAILNNIGHLYKDVCKIQDTLNRPYCKKAISYYQILINKYRDFSKYKDISIVYLKLGDQKKALENYELYKKKTNKGESWIEKELGISDNL